MPIFDALQQSNNSLLFFPGKESSINDVRKSYLHRTLDFLTKNKFENFVYMFNMLTNKTKT